MARRGTGAGPLLALLGSAMAAVAPFLHWYRVDLSSQFRQALGGQGNPLGEAFGNALAEGFGRAIEGLVPHSLAGTGWQVFDATDLALFGGGVVVALAILAGSGFFAESLNVDATAAARLATIAGLVLGALVVYSMIDRTGPHEVVKLGAGPWVALGGCVLMALGGTIGPRARHVAHPVMVATPIMPSSSAGSVTAPSASVPPPQAR